MKKVLICGDSFSADWTVKYSGQGWPNQIAQLANVTNLSQAGCGEYKIYLQLASADLDQYESHQPQSHLHRSSSGTSW